MGYVLPPGSSRSDWAKGWKKPGSEFKMPQPVRIPHPISQLSLSKAQIAAIAAEVLKILPHSSSK
jgi:hypothetical protein